MAHGILASNKVRPYLRIERKQRGLKLCICEGKTFLRKSVKCSWIMSVFICFTLKIED